MRNLRKNGGIALSLLGVTILSLTAQAQSGVLWAWGDNLNGELGNGRNLTSSPLPVAMDGLTRIKAIAMGTGHSVALKSDGTVWACGDNLYGQLGDGHFFTTSATPLRVLNLTHVKAIAAGGNHTLALKSDGTVWAWGDNSYGQLGNGTYGIEYSSASPVQVVGLTNVKAIAAGERHSLALKSDGTVWAWGWNGAGQLGNHSFDDHALPVQVHGWRGKGFLTRIKAIAGGFAHSLALKSDGTVLAWGWNEQHQIGDGKAWGYRYTPARVISEDGSGSLSHVKAIAGGYAHSIALKSDGTVWTWGGNGQGQLGTGTTVGRFGPVQVLGQEGRGVLSDIQAIAPGSHHTVALRSDGTVWAWGWNAWGQLGDGTTRNRSTPVAVRMAPNGTPLTNILSIAAAGVHTLALVPTAPLAANGRNNASQLGGPSGGPKTTPAWVANLAPPSHITAGLGHSVALQPDGTLLGWGYNNFGQLGPGQSLLLPTPLSGLANVLQSTAGAWHTLALQGDGTVKAWGYNFFGQLGDGTTQNRSRPVTVRGLTQIVQVVGGGHHSLALDDMGVVWSWGNNFYGQLGDGTMQDHAYPLPILALPPIVAIATGCYHSMALAEDGTLYVWGFSQDGQVGDGDRRNHPLPVPVLTNVVSIAAGVFHSLAVTDGGALYAWGRNTFGQVGDGSGASRTTPVILGSGYVSVVAGGYHSFGLMGSGLTQGWGYNLYGQLGDGTTQSHLAPVPLPGERSLLGAGWYHTLQLP